MICGRYRKLPLLRRSVPVLSGNAAYQPLKYKRRLTTISGKGQSAGLERSSMFLLAAMVRRTAGVLRFLLATKARRAGSFPVERYTEA
jgi:hypothetical protein